jgi:hypothetical protein
VQGERQSGVLDFEHWRAFCSDAVAGGGARDQVALEIRATGVAQA